MSASQVPTPQNDADSHAGKTPLAEAKPGSRHEKLDLPNDFGASVQNTVEVAYASHAALNQDPGRRQEHAGDDGGGARQSGAGSANGSAGTGSGGDLDPTFIGLDGRGGLAADIPDRKERADSIHAARQIDRPLPHGTPAKGENQDPNRVGISDDLPRGSVVDIDADTEADGESRGAGANSLRMTANDDPYADATAGEVSVGESDPNDASSSSSGPDA